MSRRERADELVQELFGNWYSSLIRYGLKLSGNRSLCEDAVQETFLLLYRDLCQGRNIPNPKAWTLLVMKRIMLRQMKSQSLNVPIEDDLCPDVDPQLIAIEARGDQELTFDTLSPRETEVLLLRMQAMKYREIATALSISPNSVNKLLSRAIDKLRRIRSASSKTVFPDLKPDGLQDTHTSLQ